MSWFKPPFIRYLKHINSKQVDPGSVKLKILYKGKNDRTAGSGHGESNTACSKLVNKLNCHI